MFCTFGDVFDAKKKGFLPPCLDLFTILLGRYLTLSLHHANCVSVSMFLCMFLCMCSVKRLTRAINSCFMCLIGKTFISTQDLPGDMQIYKMADIFSAYMVGFPPAPALSVVRDTVRPKLFNDVA